MCSQTARMQVILNPGIQTSRRRTLRRLQLQPPARCLSSVSHKRANPRLVTRPLAYITDTRDSPRSQAGSFDAELPSEGITLTPEQAQSLTLLDANSNVYTILKDIQSPTALADALRTDTLKGIRTADSQAMTWRQATFGRNFVPPPAPRTFLQLLGDAFFGDFTVQILAGAGAASLGLEFWLAGKEGGQADWLEGASILTAVAVVLLVAASNNWQQQRQFLSLQAAAMAERRVRAIRNGNEAELNARDVVVGDVLFVEAGDVVIADGVLISGVDVRVDESTLTGEADDVARIPRESQAMRSGAKVVSGVGRMLVTAVGKRSQSGAIAELVMGRGENSNATIEGSSGRGSEETPLQRQLGAYAGQIGRLGLAAAALATAAMTVRYSYATFIVEQQPWGWQHVHSYLEFFIQGVTILVVAVPEGLPLALTLSLAFSVLRMLEDNNLVRQLSAAEVMGTVNVICTDKTGTLTMNEMRASKLWLAGESVPDVLQYCDSFAGSGGDEVGKDARHGKYETLGTSIATWASMDEINDGIRWRDEAKAALSLMEVLERRVRWDVIRLLYMNIALNSTASVYTNDQGELQESGNRTEIGLLRLGLGLALAGGSPQREGSKDDVHTEPRNGYDLNHNGFEVIAQAPFSSERKCMTTIAACQASTGRDGIAPPPAMAFVKGAAEVVMPRCSWQLRADGTKAPLSDEDKATLVENFQDGALRVLVLAYKEVPLPRNYQASPIDTTALLHSVDHDLVLLGLVGLQDPLRPEATGAVNACHRAGVRVVMLTGDNATTATAIAQQCHILPSLHHARDHDSFAVMEGKELRSRVLREDGSVDDHQFLKIWPRLRVVARCSPEDKYVLVNAARRCAGEVVAVTGDGTNDAPALRAAAVGFAMNNGTAVAKEAADIVLLDDNFASITSALLWGRGTYANVARFLQFQLTINVVAVATAVGGALTTAQSPLTAVQMLWVNLIMDSLASLALATEPPELALLDAPPYAPDHDFLSLKSPLAKHVVGQATYQLVVMAWLLGFAPEVLHFPAHAPGQEASLHHTLVFNAFVVMQLFNQVNARKVADVENIAEGLLQASMFAAILCGEAVLQAVLVEKGGPAFGTVPLPFEMWALCLGFGAGSFLVRELLRRLPNFMGGRNGT